MKPARDPLSGTRPGVPPSVVLLTGVGTFALLGLTLLLPGSWLRYALLLWLAALLPPFVLAYRTGLVGAAVGFLFGITALAGAQALASAVGYAPPRWPLALVLTVALVIVAIATGIVSELLHRERERAMTLAFTDDLTALPNRRYARIFLEHEFAAAARGRPLAVVLFDLDRFKGYNDRHGHAAGDVALRAFADLLQRATRRMNVSARIGGEEFLSILSGCSIEGALVFVERVRVDTLRLELAGGEHITVSAGLVGYDPRMRGLDDLLAAADNALYQAKVAGRDRAVIFQREPSAPGPDGPQAAGGLPADGERRSTADTEEVAS